MSGKATRSDFKDSEKNAIVAESVIFATDTYRKEGKNVVIFLDVDDTFEEA